MFEFFNEPYQIFIGLILLDPLMYVLHSSMSILELYLSCDDGTRE